MSEVASSMGLKGPGTVVLVVGASGVGKDALIAGAAEALAGDARMLFVTRHITRAPHASEAFVSVSEPDFRAGLTRGDYALSWMAHGLGYGIPRDLDTAIAAGRIAVFNASRTAIEPARARYAHVRVVLIDCPVEVRADRIAARGRETRADVAARLARRVDGFEASTADVVIDNSGPIEEGVARLVAALRELAN
ncbi:MAG: phosphonate metabolism protein/1,5-bisphosphokinase (PRPP-forming) PhnN [Hyphomicrobiaceae bacterium]|nr:phosphonate metabolism protein/1,5-bisphosphokinase (PRPP-forming) PhnN [Hyphomicrobiaceae bacterium]